MFTILYHIGLKTGDGGWHVKRPSQLRIHGCSIRRGQQNVLWLQISVDHIPRMDIAHGFAQPDKSRGFQVETAQVKHPIHFYPIIR